MAVNMEKRGTITHLLVKDLADYKNLKSSNEIMNIDNTDIDIIVVVGKLLKQEKQFESRINLKIYDNRDSVNVIINKKFDEQSSKILDNVSLEENKYYKFFLNMKYWKETNYIVFKISPLKCFSEYTFHLMMCIKDKKERKGIVFNQSESDNNAVNINNNGSKPSDIILNKIKNLIIQSSSDYVTEDLIFSSLPIYDKDVIEDGLIYLCDYGLLQKINDNYKLP